MKKLLCLIPVLAFCSCAGPRSSESRVFCPTHRVAMEYVEQAHLREDIRDLKGRFVTSPVVVLNCYICPKGPHKVRVMLPSDPRSRSLPPPLPYTRNVIQGQPWLDAGVLNVTNSCMIEWQAVGNDGSGSTVASLYTGLAYQLTAKEIADGDGLFIEASTNLFAWSAYPSAGFQATLVSTNPSVLLPAAMFGGVVFFRGRVGKVN